MTAAGRCARSCLHGPGPGGFQPSCSTLSVIVPPRMSRRPRMDGGVTIVRCHEAPRHDPVRRLRCPDGAGADRGVHAREPVPGRDRPDTRRIEACVAGTEAGAYRLAERGGGAVGRRRLRPTLPVRGAVRDADPRSHRVPRFALLELPHHRVVHSYSRLPDDRTQPSLARVVGDHRDVTGLPGAQQLHRFRARLPARDASRARLQHVRGRQVAPHRADRVDHCGAVQPVAARSGLRAVLRLPGGIDRSLVPRPRVRQPSDSRTRHAGGGLPPQHRSRRPRHPVREGRPRPRARQAVLHVLRARRRPLAAPCGTRVDREVLRAASTLDGTSIAASCSSARWPRESCRETRCCPNAIPTFRRGTACRPRRSACTPARWRCTRPSSSRPTITSGASSTSSTNSANSTTRSSS